MGKYEGSVVFGDMVTSATWYVVHKNNTEPLISGSTAEKLGIIKCQSDISPDEAKSQMIVYVLNLLSKAFVTAQYLTLD